VTSSPEPISSISAQVEPETPVIPDKLCDKEFTLSGAGGTEAEHPQPRFGEVGFTSGGESSS